MANKEYDPAVAARIKKSTYEYFRDISKRRIEPMSKIVRTACYEHEEKLRRVEESQDA